MIAEFQMRLMPVCGEATLRSWADKRGGTPPQGHMFCVNIVESVYMVGIVDVLLVGNKKQTDNASQYEEFHVQRHHTMLRSCACV